MYLIFKCFCCCCFCFVFKPGEPIAQSSPISNYTGYQNGNGNYASNDANQSTDPETNDGLERSRSHKKRDFFGTLKRRLGRSKSRAKSLERQGAVPIDANNPNGKNSISFSVSLAKFHENIRNWHNFLWVLQYYSNCTFFILLVEYII